MSIRFITDSGSDINLDYAKEKGIKVVPLSVTFDGIVSFKEDETFDLMGYYSRYKTDKNFFAKTAQPTPKDFYDAYVTQIEDGAKEIIVVTVSSGLSGTINSANQAAKMIKKEHKNVIIHIVDALNASQSEVLLVEEGLKLRDEGVSGEEIAEKLRELTKNIKTQILFPSLKYLHKGGRISITKYVLGSLLKKKPITIVNAEGKNEVAASVKKFRDGYFKMIELTTENYTRFPAKIVIIHGNVPEKAKRMKRILNKEIPDAEIRIVCTGVTISAHTGPGVVALISEFR